MPDIDYNATTIAHDGIVMIKIDVREHNAPNGTFIILDVTPEKARAIAQVIITGADQADAQMPAMPHLDPPPT